MLFLSEENETPGCKYTIESPSLSLKGGIQGGLF